jgi:precorrin-3B synthase
MTGPAIRGWCPGAHRPMVAGDGLVVRVRPPEGALEPHQARGLADLAERHANGLVELTNRANLQLRGVAAPAHGALIDGLAALDLIDDDPEVEGRRNIVVDPLRPVAADDPQAQAARLLAKQLAAAEFAALPSKFGFVVDAGPHRRLADTSGDIRIEASAETLIVRSDGHPTGRAADDPAQAADWLWTPRAGSSRPAGSARMGAGAWRRIWRQAHGCRRRCAAISLRTRSCRLPSLASVPSGPASRPCSARSPPPTCAALLPRRRPASA